MSEFNMNRRWTFILALFLLFACSLPRATFADPTLLSHSVLVDDSQGGGLSGDPDVPTGTGKTASSKRGGSRYGIYAAGDSGSHRSVMVSSLKMFMVGLKGYWIRF